MRYPRSYNPFSSGSDEDEQEPRDSSNPFHTSDEDVGDNTGSDRGSMVNLLTPARDYNPFLSSGDEENLHHIHNKERKNTKRSRHGPAMEYYDPFVSSDEDEVWNKTKTKQNPLLKNNSEYNPFSSSDEEEQSQLLDRDWQTTKPSKDTWQRGKMVGMLVISLGMLAMLVMIILVITENPQLFFKDTANTIATTTVIGEIINNDLENISVIERGDHDDDNFIG